MEASKCKPLDFNVGNVATAGRITFSIRSRRAVRRAEEEIPQLHKSGDFRLRFLKVRRIAISA